ncbi:MAG TPA: bifunctional riboflavin kinase/FAD synthetase [Mariprofundaceae bacterium]|nr:bifunctional riboflavin kinase/FAD synthetase [Mariprofundaceae bacterium]
MKILHSWNSAKSFTDAHGGAITVGNFDGVHMGHEQVLAEVRGHALDVNGPAIAVTFEPHPRAILFPDEKPRRLCHLHERLELLKRAGMDAVMLLHFNREMATWTPETFIRKLHAAFRFKHMHVGYDFAFGHDRSGDADSLRLIGEGLQFTVSEAAAFEMHGAVVSSSRIRSSIEAADFKLTEELLGRPYSMSGHVGKGDQRGRELGFPTANLDVKELAHPPVGVYAVRAECRGKIWDAAAYFGYRPTFRGRTLVLETHIFDAHPDLYKKRLKVHFIERVREDRAFKSAEALAEQIAKDCAVARDILSQRDKT